jgi:N-acetyltransferase
MAPIFVTPAAKTTNTNKPKKQPPRLAPIFASASGSAAAASASIPAATSANGGSGGETNQHSDDEAYSASDDESRRSGLVPTSTQHRHRRPPLAPLFATPRTNLDGIALMSVTPSTEATMTPSDTATLAAASSSRSDRKRPRSTGSRDRSDITQMYLDLGQSNFAARSICAICGMMTVHGMDEDDAEHDKVCAEYRNGVSFLGWKNERVVATFPPSPSGMAANGAARIIEVRPSDPAQHRRRVRRVKVIVDQELGFADSSSSAAAPRASTAASGGDFASAEGGGNGSDDIDGDDASLFGKTAFLYVVNKTVVGLCTVEIIRSAHRLLDASSSDKEVSITMANLHRSMTPTKAIMGVHQLWCHSSHRKGRVATHLVDAARSRLVYGMTIPHDMVAFSSPTVDGLAFAKKYVETETPMVYDCH